MSRKPTTQSKRTTARRSETAPSTLDETALPLGFASLAGFVSFIGFAFLALIAPYLFSDFWPSSYEYWSYALFLALTACLCALLALEPSPTLSAERRPVLSLILIVFFVWSAFSLVGTAYLHDSLLELARIGGVVACFFLAQAFFTPQKYLALRLKWVFAAVLAGGVLVCVPAVYDFLVTRNPRQFGTFYNPNLFANYSAMLLPLSLAGAMRLWQTMRHSSAEKRAASAALLAVGISIVLIVTLGLIVTSSKGGFLAALCGVLVFAVAVFCAKGKEVRTVFRARKVVFIVCFVLVVLGVGVLFSQTILPRLSADLESDHSTMFRIYTWAGTIKMAQASPLTGWGIGSFPTVYTQFAETGYTRSAHQSWLQIAAETGFPAMLLLLGACGWAFVRGWKKLREKNSQDWLIVAGSLGALGAFFVHGLTDSGWGVVSVGVLLALVWASLDTDARESASIPREARSAVRWPLLLLALPLALGSWLYQRAQNAEDLRGESRESMARGLATSAGEQALEATAADPLSARIWLNWAQTQRATGEKPAATMEKVLALQPMRALNSLDYAEYLIETQGDKNRIRELLEKAVQLDPHDPKIRSVYSEWLLENGDSQGWEQLEKIVALADAPYGKYPATPEIVDLNFARAYAKLAARAVENRDDKNAKKLIERGLEQIVNARQYETQRREMETAIHGAPDEARARELDELDLQLRALERELDER